MLQFCLTLYSVGAEVNVKEQLSPPKTWKCSEWRCSKNEDCVENTIGGLQIIRFLFSFLFDFHK